MHLRVRTLEGDIAEPVRPGKRTCPINRRGGDVDPERAARMSRPRRLTGRQPTAAPDIQHLVTGPNAGRPPQNLVVSPQFVVVADQRFPKIKSNTRAATSPTPALGG